MATGMKQGKSKTFTFAIIANVILLLFLELNARIFLSISARSFHFFSYGLTNEDTLHMKQFIKVTSSDGKMLYYKSVPSNDVANPVNSLGLRGEEIVSDRQESMRVVCLGGSTTYGSGIPYKDTFPKLLQDKLDLYCGKNYYEIINAGQPGFNLEHIINMTKREVLPLNPDVVILMSVINNFIVPGISNADDNLVEVKDFIVKHFCIGLIIHDLFTESYESGFISYIGNFNWAHFAKTLMSSPSVWSEYERKLNILIECIRNHNPSSKFIILEQPFNSINFPEMQEPYKRALGIMTKTADSHENIDLLYTQTAIIDAMQDGNKMWQAPHIDPVHLLRGGNEILASLLFDKLGSECHPYDSTDEAGRKIFDSRPEIPAAPQADSYGIKKSEGLQESSRIETHWLEAEYASTIAGPLEIVGDEDDSEGRYMYAPNGAGDRYEPGPIMATYTVTTARGGSYFLWGRVKVSDKRDNSFFVQVDDGGDNLWEVEAGDHWHWDAINDRNGEDPVKFTLTEGLHTIKIKMREDGTKLDKMVLTNDEDFIPRSNGAPLENQGNREVH